VGSETTVYNTSATGGSRVGGFGSISIIYNINVVGGSLAGGVGSISTIYNIVPAGGSIAGGVSLQTFSDVVEVSGGSLAGGVGSISTIYNIAPTGGSLAGGVGLETFSDVVEVTGGLLAGGTRLETVVYNIVSNEIYSQAGQSTQLLLNSEFDDGTNGWVASQGFQIYSAGSGGKPAILNGSLVFSHNDASNVVSQTVNVNTTGIDKFDSVLNIRHNQNGGSNYTNIDKFYFLVLFKDNQNNTLATKRFPSVGTENCPQSPTDYTLTLTRQEIFNFDSISSITVSIFGDDTGFWAGNYGPVVDYVRLTAVQNFINIEGSSKLSGLGETNIFYNHLPTSGSTTTGSSSATINNFNLTSGGISAGGLASIITQYAVSAAGGIVVTGLSNQTLIGVAETSGQILFGGEAIATVNYLTTTTSGTQVSGETNATARYQIISTNGLSITGAAKQSVNYLTTTTGGSLIGGISLETFNDVVEVSGGSLAGGIGLEKAVYNIVSTGGLLADGAGSEKVTYNSISANGSLAGGIGLEKAVYNIVSTGGSLAGGIGLETVVYNINTTGGLLVNIVKNIDGTLDSSFNIGTGFNDEVWSIAIQNDDKILCCGSFTSYNGTTRNRIVRLNSDGTLDSSFNIGTGFNSLVLSITIQSDGKILCGGPFTSYNGTTRNRIVRLNSDGTLDSSFNIGTGFNAQVFSIAIQSDGKILCGGSFTSYNGTT